MRAGFSPRRPVAVSPFRSPHCGCGFAAALPPFVLLRYAPGLSHVLPITVLFSSEVFALSLEATRDHFLPFTNHGS
jgi:hypothetical protein